jgi:hypothetical protein
LQPTPLSPDFDPLGFPEGWPAPSGFGGSLHPCCSEERRQVSRFCSVAWPEGQRNSAVSLGSDRPKTLFASPAPPERSEDHSCFAVAPARFRPKTLRFRRLAPLDPSEDVSNIAIAPPRRPEGFLNLAPIDQV